MAQINISNSRPVIELTEAEPATVNLESIDYEAAQDSPALRGRYSRPSAPTFELAKAPACPPLPPSWAAKADDDPNTTTLVSANYDGIPESDRPSTRRDGGWVKVEVEEAAPEEQVEDGDPEVDFFAAARESYPPVVEDVPQVERAEAIALTAAEASRRATLRRVVAGTVGALALVALGLGAKAMVSGAPAVAERHQAIAATIIANEAPPAARARQAKAAMVDAALASEPATEPAAEQAGEPSYQQLAEETVRLLNERQFDEAAAKARQLVAVAPTKAYGYRCLGSALQDKGDHAGARDAYRQCVAQATEGDVYECSALIGR